MAHDVHLVAGYFHGRVCAQSSGMHARTVCVVPRNRCGND